MKAKEGYELARVLAARACQGELGRGALLVTCGQRAACQSHLG